MLKRKFVVAAALLAGCGGGSDSGGGSGGSATLPLPPVIVVDDAPQVTVPPGARAIVGIHGTTQTGIFGNQLRRTSGSEAPDGTVTLADGRSIFMGQSGFASGVQVGDNGVIRRNPASDVVSASVMYSGAITNAPGVEPYGIFQGIYGPPAGAGPLSVSADYLGTAEAVYADGGRSSKPVFMNDGIARIGANFAAGTVNLQLTQFAANSAPLDEIFLTDMPINQDRYGGGTFTLVEDGADVDVTGANTEAVATGLFLGGLDASGVPLETGGLIYIRGDDGAVSASYLGALQP